MSDIFKDAYNAGRTDGNMPTTKNLTREEAHQVIDAYFQGVQEKQEREARDGGYGTRYTNFDQVEKAFDSLNNTDHGSLATFIAQNTAALINSDTTISALMDPHDDGDQATFVVECSDMNIVERYRVTVERAD